MRDFAGRKEKKRDKMERKFEIERERERDRIGFLEKGDTTLRAR